MKKSSLCGFVLVAFMLGVIAGKASAQNLEHLPTSITDLPPAIVAGQRDIDLLVDSAPFSEVILRVCRTFRATCAVSGAPSLLVGYSCQGDAFNCWRAFMQAVSAGGVRVRVAPAVGGASYVFVGARGSNSLRRVSPESSEPELPPENETPPPPEPPSTPKQ